MRPGGSAQREVYSSGISRTQGIALCVSLIALMGASLIAQAIDQRFVQESEVSKPILFPRIAILRPALLGFDGLAADVTWIRTIQYFGDRVERAERFPQLYQLVDMTTSLDPHFVDAYVYGGLFLVIAKQFHQAIAIYKKGIAANPKQWQLPHDLGRLYFLDLHDYDQALHWWQATDGLPGRPDYIPRFLIRLQAKTGQIQTALELWQQMLEHSGNESVRAIARREIQKLIDEMKRRRNAGPPA